MPRIVFELDVKAEADEVLRALDSQSGIASWWTDDVVFAGGAGSTMTLGFPIAPRPFELRVDAVTKDVVRWTSIGEFPPHWTDTTMTWTLKPAGAGPGTTVHFSHDGWASDDSRFATAALTWAQLMLSLKQLAETGSGTPLFRTA